METLQPKLRFPEFSGNWEEKELGEIGKFIGGGTPSTKDINFWNGTIPWISSSDITEENIYKINSTRFITEQAVLNSATKIIPKNSILIVSRVGVGKVAVNSVDLCTSQDFTNLIINNENYLYTAYLIKYKTNKLLEFNQGTSIKGFVKSDLETLKISFPSLQEQTKIASFLTEIDTKINQLTQKKDLLEKYKKGIMQKIFNQEIRFKDDKGKDYEKWKINKIGKISKIYDGTHQTPNYVEEGVPFFSVEHISANQFEKTKYISEEVFEKENKRVELQKGDILMTRIGSIGVAKYINWDVKASFYVSLALIKQSSNINNEYLCHFINTDFFQEELWKRTIHVAFPQKINLGEINDCLVKIPVLEEQTKIANFLSAIDDKINQVAIQLEKTTTYKKGLLQQMFV